MLDRVRDIRDACDLDLLLFFRRHPRALLTPDDLATRLGYGHERISKALDGLIATGLLKQYRTPSHAACLYVLEPGGPPDESFSPLLDFASSREGRLEMLRLLASALDGSTRAGARQASLTG